MKRGTEHVSRGTEKSLALTSAHHYTFRSSLFLTKTNGLLIPSFIHPATFGSCAQIYGAEKQNFPEEYIAARASLLLELDGCVFLCRVNPLARQVCQIFFLALDSNAFEMIHVMNHRCKFLRSRACGRLQKYSLSC